MVGIARRSRACGNCRKRRVSCGSEHPACIRCRDASLNCQGYQKGALFINRTIASPSTTVQQVVRTSSFQGDYHQDILDDYYSMSRDVASSAYATVHFRRAAFRILSRLYLPSEGMTDASLAIGAGLWVSTICNCVQESPVLDLSLLGLCAAQLYITRHVDISLEHALEVYSRGLSALAEGLQRIDSKNLACLLGSIVALSTCELFISPTTSGWRAHAQGMAKLLHFRIDFNHEGAPPEVWVPLCARARIVDVLTSLMSQIPVNVTAAEWRAFMPERPDDPLDDLLDLVSELPTLFQSMAESGNDAAPLFQVLKLIYDWEQRFRSRANSNYSFVPSQLSNPADRNFDEKLHPLVLSFPALQIATCLIVCWGAMLQTLAMIARQHKQAGSELLLDLVWTFLDKKLFKHATPETAIAVEAKRRAGLLCQCVEYTHQDKMGSIGPQAMTYARGILLRFFTEQQRPRELAWCQQIPYMTNQRGEKLAVQMLNFRA